MTSSAGDEPVSGASEPELGEERQRKSFEFAGPLFSVTISPASTIVRVAERRELRALLRDRSRRRVETDLEFHWQVIEGPGRLDGAHDQAVTFRARMGWDSRGSR